MDASEFIQTKYISSRWIFRNLLYHGGRKFIQIHMKTNEILPEENNKIVLLIGIMLYTKHGIKFYEKKRINSSEIFALQRDLNDHLKHDAACKLKVVF